MRYTNPRLLYFTTLHHVRLERERDVKADDDITSLVHDRCTQRSTDQAWSRFSAVRNRAIN